jgi:hypothetical protein
MPKKGKRTSDNQVTFQFARPEGFGPTLEDEYRASQDEYRRQLASSAKKVRNIENDRRFILLSAAAEQFKVHLPTLSRWASKNRKKSGRKKVGRNVYVLRDVVRAYAETLKMKARTQAIIKRQRHSAQTGNDLASVLAHQMGRQK